MEIALGVDAGLVSLQNKQTMFGHTPGSKTTPMCHARIRCSGDQTLSQILCGHSRKVFGLFRDSFECEVDLDALARFGVAVPNTLQARNVRRVV